MTNDKWLFADLIGVKVICVDNQPRPGRGLSDAPLVGGTYTISKVGIGHFNELCIGLREIKRTAPGRWGFAAWRFKKAPK